MSKEEICGHTGECIVLKVYLHCENCSKPVVKCLNNFPGVEEVIADVKNDMVIVKGKGVDPKALADRLNKKCNKQVDIISPVLQPVCKIYQAPTIQDEVKLIHVVLNVYIHCRNCGNNFKARLLKMKGVRKVEVEFEKSEVKVEGIFEAEKLVEYVDLRMGKQATIIIVTFPAEEIKKSNPICPPKTNVVVDEEDDMPKMIRCNCCCWETYPSPESHHFFHASQILRDECTQSCSVM